MKKQITILSIDDDEQIRFALNELFKFQGWNPLSADSVDSGLAHFRQHQPDIILIDYHMPRINGVEGVRILRALSPTVPIIVFTIDESQAVADTFLEAGATDFALKPIKAPDIISRIKLHLRLLDRAGEGESEQRPATLAKGICQGTLDLIREFLSGQTDYLTANDIAEGTGLAYQTVYRYLQHMTQEKQVEMINIYGKVGRPKQVYRKV